MVTVTPNLIIVAALGFIVLSSVAFTEIDKGKRRKVKSLPLISVLIPAYNNGKHLEETLKHICESYPLEKFEIIVVNDGSTDNTREVLERLKSEYSFRTINNETNEGKAISINRAFGHAKGEVIMVVDSDVIINEMAIKDMLSRLGSNPKVGGVSCGCKVRNAHGFLAVMQDVEYRMLSFIQGSYNPFSTISLWGGCMAFKRRAFIEIGGLSPNFIAEDMDSAMKLKEHGWKAEQSHLQVYTFAPEDFRGWFRQKLRWSSGTMQNFIKHTKMFFSNPLVVAYMVAISIFAISAIYNLIGSLGFIASQTSQASTITQNVGFAILYSLFNLPYVLYSRDYRKNPLRMLRIFPYSWIYYPIFMAACVIGFAGGIFRYRALARGERAW